MTQCCCECPQNRKPLVLCSIEGGYFRWSVKYADVAMLIVTNLQTRVVTETPIVLVDGEASGLVPVLVGIESYEIMGSNKCGTNRCNSFCLQPTCCHVGVYNCNNYHISRSTSCNTNAAYEYLDGSLFQGYSGYFSNFSNNGVIFNYPAPEKHTITLISSCNNRIDCEIINPCFSTKTNIIGIISGLEDIDYIRENSGNHTPPPFGPGGTFYQSQQCRVTGLSNLNGTYSFLMADTLDEFGSCEQEEYYIGDILIEVIIINESNTPDSTFQTYSYSYNKYSYTLEMYVIESQNLGSNLRYITLYSKNCNQVIAHPSNIVVYHDFIEIINYVGGIGNVFDSGSDTYYLCEGCLSFPIQITCEEPSINNYNYSVPGIKVGPKRPFGGSLDFWCSNNSVFFPFLDPSVVPTQFNYRTEGYFV